MIIERIVYCLVCLILFGYIVKKYLNSKSGIYLSLLAIQFVCILTQLIAFFTKIYVDGFMQLYILVFNILIPAGVFATDYLNINFEEFLEIKLGDFYARRNKYDKAIEKYKKAVSKNNNNAQTFAKLGRIYNAKGDRRTAFDRFARAIEIDRNDYRSYYEIGVIFNDMGKHSDAQIVLDNSLRIKPDFTPASELLAVVLCAQNKYDEAINVYKNATRYDPDNYQLYYRMGVVRTELRDFNEAKECYEKAIELNPSLYQAFFSLGQINLLKGELDQAEMMFKKSMVSKELTAKSYYQLAKVYILNDEEIKAVTYLGYAIDIDSSYKYKAESEPLFAKIKDYITGLSMANKVMQQAENMENLRKKENDVEDYLDNKEDNSKVQSYKVHSETESQSYDNVFEHENMTSNQAEEAASDDEEMSSKENYEPKESKFFKMMKSVLGFEETVEAENFEQETRKEIEKKTEQDTKEKIIEEIEKNYADNKALYEERENVESVRYTNNFKDDENSSKSEEIAEFEKEIKVEGSSTLDIFEKFKKLKKEEDEKAERLRRIQKIKQLEELKKQEANQESSERQAMIDSNEYAEEEEPIVVRTVGTNDSEIKVKSYEENSDVNENFEDEDTMDEPHFDFMDRFKRK